MMFYFHMYISWKYCIPPIRNLHPKGEGSCYKFERSCNPFKFKFELGVAGSKINKTEYMFSPMPPEKTTFKKEPNRY